MSTEKQTKSKLVLWIVLGSVCIVAFVCLVIGLAVKFNIQDSPPVPQVTYSPTQVPSTTYSSSSSINDQSTEAPATEGPNDSGTDGSTAGYCSAQVSLSFDADSFSNSENLIILLDMTSYDFSDVVDLTTFELATDSFATAPVW
jgi:hypothetical protein